MARAALSANRCAGIVRWVPYAEPPIGAALVDMSSKALPHASLEQRTPALHTWMRQKQPPNASRANSPKHQNVERWVDNAESRKQQGTTGRAPSSQVSVWCLHCSLNPTHSARLPPAVSQCQCQHQAARQFKLKLIRHEYSQRKHTKHQEPFTHLSVWPRRSPSAVPRQQQQSKKSAREVREAHPYLARIRLLGIARAPDRHFGALLCFPPLFLSGHEGHKAKSSATALRYALLRAMGRDVCEGKARWDAQLARPLAGRLPGGKVSVSVTSRRTARARLSCARSS
ncbi:hypothetical protein IWZ00DRAFT_484412 [Phyllosticta capitalensis]